MKDPHPDSGSPAGMTRRTALKAGIVGIVGATVGAGSTAFFTRWARTVPSRYHNFTGPEAELLAELCEQIIPRDDAPGAADAGAVDYIDRQLDGVFARHLGTYHRGLEAFRRTCLQSYGRSFHELTAAERTTVVHSIEAGRAPKELWDNPSPQAFFELVLAHTMQGFYGSPRHGGNRDYASYRMLGLDYPQIVGRNRVAQG